MLAGINNPPSGNDLVLWVGAVFHPFIGYLCEGPAGRAGEGPAHLILLAAARNFIPVSLDLYQYLWLFNGADRP